MKKILFYLLGFIVCGALLTAQTLDEALDVSPADDAPSAGSEKDAKENGSSGKARKERERIVQAANSRNNWIGVLGGVGGCGPFPIFPLLSSISIGANYERMLGPKISLGANIFWTRAGAIFTSFDTLEIDVPFRFYPLGKTFFLGAALGFYYSHSYNRNVDPGTRHATSIGAAITPEIGWKIDVGKPGKLYLQTGIAQPLWFGRTTGYEATVSGFDIDGIIMGKTYFGMGYAF